MLLTQLTVDWLLTELIVELVSQSLSSIQPLLGGVYHNLADEVNQERVSFGEDLNK